jgi:hypothetical protein
MRLPRLILIALFLSAELFAGGWVSSGGDGVLCFPAKHPRAKEFTGLVNADYKKFGLLQPATKALVLPAAEELTVLEYWETREQVWLLEAKKKKGKTKVSKDRDPNLPYEMGIYVKARSLDAHLQELEEHLYEHAPLFLRLYKHFARSIHVGNTKFGGALSDVKDSRSRFDLSAYPNCAMVQLAVRKSEEQKGLATHIETEIDKDFYEKLRDDLNRAMLFSHERLSAIAVALGFRHSNNLRQLNAELFRTQHWLDTVMNPSLPRAALNVHDWLEFLTGNYYELLPELEEFQAAELAKRRETALTRGLLELRTKQLAHFYGCLKYLRQQNPKSKSLYLKDYRYCRVFGDDPTRVEPLSDVAAFVFLSQAKHIESHQIVNLNSLMLASYEHLLDFGKETADKDRTELFEQYCALIENAQDVWSAHTATLKKPGKQYEVLLKLLGQGVKYCKGVKDL